MKARDDERCRIHVGPHGQDEQALPDDLIDERGEAGEKEGDRAQETVMRRQSRSRRPSSGSPPRDA